MMRIAVLPGDGIGQEVIPAGVKVLRHAASLHGVELHLEELPWGADHYLKTGVTLPEEEFERLPAEFDAIYLGALGDPRVRDGRHAREILLGLRFRLDLYINLRPIRLWREALCPLKGKGVEDVNFAVFRENTEGLYVGVGGNMRRGTSEEIAVQEMICTRRGTERIIRAAFEYAVQHGRRRVCMADKANALEQVGSLWRRTFAAVAAEYPQIETRLEYIDALCMHLLRKPEAFEVIVTGNMFGDILTDLGAALQGGLGMAVSGNIHPGRIGLFEPVHGSAPDIAGQGKANPIAAILTAALMMEQSGHVAVARSLERAVAGALEAGETTPDLGGHLDLADATEAILGRVAAS